MTVRIAVLLCLMCPIFLPGVAAANPEMIIEMISADIERTKDNKQRSTLHIYRARQLVKVKQWDKALADYNTALTLDHKGWIQLERSQFLLGRGEYEKAYKDATAAKEKVPTLAAEADKVIDKAVAVVREKYEAENPITIIMDGPVDRGRRTRFDVMREQGVFVAKANRIAAANAQRSAKRKQTAKAKSACGPTTVKRKRG